VIRDAAEGNRSEEALAARTRQLGLIARTAQRLRLAAEPEHELLESIFSETAQLIDWEMFLHYRPSETPRMLRLRAHGGITEEEEHLFATMRFGELLCGLVAERRERLIIEDLQHSTHPGSDVLRGAGATGYAGFPLLAHGELVGTIAFASRRRTHLRVGDVQTIQAICDQIAVTLERSRLEHDLRASEERARLALEGGDLGSWDVDLQSGASVWNRRHAELQGYGEGTPASMERWESLVHPEDLPNVHAAMERARLNRTPFVVEHRLRRADTGEERWLALYGRYFYDEQGVAVRLSGISREATKSRSAEVTLRESEARFRRASEAVGTLVYETDLTGTNPAMVHGFEAVVGERPDEPLTSDTWHSRIHPHDLAGHLTRLQAVLASDAQRWADHYRVRHADGSWRHVEDVAEIVRAADGAATRLVGTTLDVTERVEQELALIESERRFRAMADQTPIVMWVTDAKGDLDFVNEAYCVFFGVNAHELRGSDWRPLVHPDDHAYLAEFVEALRARRPFQASARVRRADGEWRWITSVGRPCYAPDGEFIGMIGVSPDVTDQRRATEMELEAARQKDEFIAVLAHELRNPLAPIRTSVGVLRAASPSEPHLRECRDIIDRQVAHMARLLDDLLDVSRLSRGKLTLQRSMVRLRDIVDHAVETVRSTLDDRGHVLTVDRIDPSLVLDADPARLTQILTNVLNNAVKYTNRGGRIWLEVATDDGRVSIRVRDNGIGLKPEMRERIFELFSQVEDSRQRADGGLGIGLGLTKRLVEMHRGSITVESPGPQQGSTFTVTLPLHGTLDKPASERETPSMIETEPMRRRVLVVDDNVDAADSLAMLLETLGCESRTAYEGESALREATAFKPDLVLLDLGMPGLDGQTVCNRLRAEEWGREIVIAAVTGWGQDEDRRRTRAAGFDRHLVKPVDPDVVATMVRDLPRRPAI